MSCRPVVTHGTDGVRPEVPAIALGCLTVEGSVKEKNPLLTGRNHEQDQKRQQTVTFLSMLSKKFQKV